MANFEFLDVFLSVSDATGGNLEQCVLDQSREHLWLVLRSRSTRDLALEACVGHQLDGELEHEAVGVLLRQLVEQFPPGREMDHLLQPRRDL